MQLRPRKPLLLKLGVFLLLGAIVNVAVAWCGQIPDLFRNDLWEVASNEERDRTWLQFAPPDWPPTVGLEMKYHNPLWTSQQIESVDDPGAPYIFVRCACGWPMRCLDGVKYLDHGTESVRGWAIWQWSKSAGRAGTIVLPYRISWPTLLVNTLFYAAILWLLSTILGKLRHKLRAKGSRCPACGYQIAEGVGPRCSECGHALPSVAADR